MELTGAGIRASTVAPAWRRNGGGTKMLTDDSPLTIRGIIELATEMRAPENTEPPFYMAAIELGAQSPTDAADFAYDAYRVWRNRILNAR